MSGGHSSEGTARNSTYIFEGKVIESRSFFGPGERMIHTSHLVQVYSVFKGQFPGDQVEIITEVGQVGDVMIDISHNLTLRPGNEGVFFGNPYANIENDVLQRIEAVPGVERRRADAFRQGQKMLDALVEEGVLNVDDNTEFGVIYAFDQAQLTGNNLEYLEFDVTARTSSGCYEYANSEIYITDITHSKLKI